MEKTNGIASLATWDIKDFIDIEGIGEIKAIQLKCIAEISRRMVKTKLNMSNLFNDPTTVAKYYSQDLRYRDRECVVVVGMDNSGRLLGDEIISIGTAITSLLSPREVFKVAIKMGATCIILLHNHPSGNPVPSRTDIISTKEIVRLGHIMELPIQDHIVIGDGTFFSMRKEGVVEF